MYTHRYLYHTQRNIMSRAGLAPPPGCELCTKSAKIYFVDTYSTCRFDVYVYFDTKCRFDLFSGSCVAY